MKGAGIVRFRPIILGILLSLSLGGCKNLPGLGFLTGSAPSDPTQVENGPAANRFSVGDHYTFDNPITRWQVVAVEGDQVSWLSNNGDRQITGFNPLLPARRWWSQQGGAGRRIIRDWKGALFPMKVGAEVSFRATVTSSQPPFGWEYTWSCRVTGRETVKMLDQALDTFVVVCGRENPNELTFNYAPKVGHYVVQQVAATADSPARTRRLLAYKRAGAPPAALKIATPGKPPPESLGKPLNPVAAKKPASGGNTGRPGPVPSRAGDPPRGAPAVSSVGNALNSVSLQTPDFGGNAAPESRKAVPEKTRPAPVAGKKTVSKKPQAAPAPARPRVSNTVTSRPSIPAVPKPARVRKSAPAAAVPPPPKRVAKTRLPSPPSLAGPRIGAASVAKFDSKPVPAPAPVPVPVPPAVTVARTPPVPVARTGGVHLASYRAAAKARQGWEQLARRNGDLLRGLRADIRRIDLGEKGVYYRLYAVPVASVSDGVELCRKLRQRGVFCEPQSS